MASKLHENRNWLFKRLYNDRKSIAEIAKESGTTIQTIYRYKQKFGFK